MHIRLHDVYFGGDCAPSRVLTRNAVVTCKWCEGFGTIFLVSDLLRLPSISRFRSKGRRLSILMRQQTSDWVSTVNHGTVRKRK